MTTADPDAPDRHATHVVVDGRDGTTFYRDSTGQLLDRGSAETLADGINAGCKPGYRTYRVYALAAMCTSSPPAPSALAARVACVECGNEYPNTETLAAHPCEGSEPPARRHGAA